MLAESLDGFAAAHADIVTLGEERKFVRRAQLTPGKVALISGGGSGHEPLHAGFVGHGMLDAACPGQVFTSPTPDQMIAAAEAVDGGAGVLFIVKNYEGDVMNFDMAAEMAGREIARRSSPTTTSPSRTRPIRPGGAASPARWSSRRSSAPRPRKARGLADLQDARRPGQPAHALDGRGADELHRAGGRQADLHARRGRDGDGRRHPWRARPPPRQARPRRCHRRRDGRRDCRRSRPGAGDALLLVNGFGGTPRWSSI